ncbi:hypothetical protein GCM10010174_81690 [Kutzneria viridogrisea]|uniref:Secreted protein n=2 Tax=Kutzneria TaxID=43356 RepID=W5WHH1_9PSEU|nr:SH3 domain-containing protein [Kutzneria albida]AHI00057.1 hypothetical protein KALB_6698 [Kutzneria albida DSM 43870]MBA8925236.1 hypothetical protein [Kutzneria viridogrisea]
MRAPHAATCLALTAATLLAGGATALAGTSETTYTITAWHEVKQRSCPSTSCGEVGEILAGQVWQRAVCWTHGEEITDAGITNDVWIQVRHEDGGTQWASAVYFTGDQYAGLPVSARCPARTGGRSTPINPLP